MKTWILDTMMNFMFLSPHEMGEHIAKALKSKRLSLDLSQKTLSKNAGVSFAVLKKFERTGKISLESLLKLALTLGCLNEFAALFKPTPIENLRTLDEILEEKTRKRGRK